MKKKQYTAPSLNAMRISTDALLLGVSNGVYVNSSSFVDTDAEGL